MPSENISVTVGPASTIVYSTPGTLRVGRNLTLEIDASSYVSDGSYTITCADATGVDATKMTVTRTANTCTFTIDPVDALDTSQPRHHYFQHRLHLRRRTQHNPQQSLSISAPILL